MGCAGWPRLWMTSRDICSFTTKYPVATQEYAGEYEWKKGGMEETSLLSRSSILPHFLSSTLPLVSERI